MNMPRSRLSSILFRSALAAQASVSSTSLLCSLLGKSSLPDDTEDATGSILYPSLPWIDDLHNTISIMYLGGACCPGIQNGVVQMHPDAALENPLVCYSGADEIARILRARNSLSLDDTTSLLEFVYVQASDDSIVGGKRQNYHENSSAPSIQIVYRLQKTYGKFFTMNTMLKVTVQCQNVDQCRKIMFQLPERSNAEVLATSGLTKNALGGFNVVSSGAVYTVVKDIWQRWSTKARLQNGSDEPTLPENIRDPRFVAEIVRIEECWNEVELIQPFHLSRRINGLVLGSLAYLLNCI